MTIYPFLWTSTTCGRSFACSTAVECCVRLGSGERFFGHIGNCNVFWPGRAPQVFISKSLRERDVHESDREVLAMSICSRMAVRPIHQAARSHASQESCQPGVMPARSRAREWHFNLFTKHLEHSFAREWHFSLFTKHLEHKLRAESSRI